MRSLLSVSLLFVTVTALAGDFVPGVAVSNAGSIADADKDQFFAFYIPAQTKPEAVSSDIQENLTQAAKVKANLAIIGPDYALNEKILLNILNSTPKGSLEGATILYVNGGEDTEVLKKAAALTGATFRATKYRDK